MNQDTALKAKIIEIAKAGIGWLQKQKVNTVKEAAISIGPSNLGTNPSEPSALSRYGICFPSTVQWLILCAGH